MEEELKATGQAVGAIAELIKTAGETPEAREAAKNIGQTAVTITKTINTALLPLAAINFAFDKAKLYFSGQFQKDLIDRTRDIPLDSVGEPKSSVAGPALQGLAFTHEEPQLKEMYLNLLATAIDKRVSKNAHPAFVEVIRQLEGEEASLLQSVLTVNGSLPIAQIKSEKEGEKGYRVVAKHLMDMQDTNTRKSVEDPRLPAMIDNWVRLGLVEVTYGEFLTGESTYAWVEKRPEFTRTAESEAKTGRKVSAQNGRIGRTFFGAQFAESVGLLPQRTV